MDWRQKSIKRFSYGPELSSPLSTRKAALLQFDPMYAVWLDSETTAMDVAWQMRTWRIKNIIFISAEDYPAFRLALALSKGRVRYCINLIHSMLTSFLIALICTNVIIHFLPHSKHQYDWVQNPYSSSIPYR
jgi:hypothetical protein